MGTFGSRSWPWVVAGVASLSLVLATDALWHSFVPDSPAQPYAPHRHKVPGTVPQMPGETLAPSPSPFPRPTPALPLPVPEKDDATRKLRVLGLEPLPAGLARAVREGDPSRIDLFLKAGISAVSTDEAGQPMLLLACDAGRLEVANRLLEWGADPNAAAPDGRTPLMTAASRGDLPLLECLVQHGSVLEQADSRGHTALHFAVFSKEVPAVEWLIAQGAPVDGNCCDGSESLLLHALDTGELAILEPVIKRARPAQWCHATREALFAAVRSQDKPWVRVLLANHGEPPTPEGFRQPLLAYAIAWGEPAVLRLLLECGADPNTPVESPVEPAFAKLIPEELMRYYLRTEKGLTPLMVAAGTGRLDCVQALLEYGAKRGVLTGKSKFAAISFAARTKHPEIMQVLLGKSPRPEDQRIEIEISLGSQRAQLWKDHRLVISAPISTGKSGYPTPSGRFVVTDKERVRTSSLYKVNMPYFMRLNCSEFGMHAGVVPDYPASHGCIRMPLEAAIRFYREVDVGTLVTIEP